MNKKYLLRLETKHGWNETPVYFSGKSNAETEFRKYVRRMKSTYQDFLDAFLLLASSRQVISHSTKRDYKSHDHRSG